jgi:hypothetical protein
MSAINPHTKTSIHGDTVMEDTLLTSIRAIEKHQGEIPPVYQHLRNDLEDLKSHIIDVLNAMEIMRS